MCRAPAAAAFWSAAHHELRTPLAALRANVQFAARTASDPMTQESLTAAQAELDELGRLVEELLALAARDEPVREVVEIDIRGAVTAAAERLTRRTQREVTVTVPERPVMAHVDPVGVAEFYQARFLEDARRLGLKVATEAAADT